MKNWFLLSRSERFGEIISRQNQGLNQTQIAGELGTVRANIKDFCRRNGIYGWKRGAQPGNKNAITTGESRNTIRRLTLKTLKDEGRDLSVCERCGASRSDGGNLARHHKDRDRTNNTRSNVEVLCSTCHAKEHISSRSRNSLGQLCNTK